eukprot:15367482-Alexandrium_andersonii.AAC.1
MDAGALEPETAELDAGAPELQAALAVLQRAFRPASGRGKGGEPSISDRLGAPASTGGTEGGGKGGQFSGRRWK